MIDFFYRFVARSLSVIIFKLISKFYVSNHLIRNILSERSQGISKQTSERTNERTNDERTLKIATVRRESNAIIIVHHSVCTDLHSALSWKCLPIQYQPVSHLFWAMPGLDRLKLWRGAGIIFFFFFFFFGGGGARAGWSNTKRHNIIYTGPVPSTEMQWRR